MAIVLSQITDQYEEELCYRSNSGWLNYLLWAELAGWVPAGTVSNDEFLHWDESWYRHGAIILQEDAERMAFALETIVTGTASPDVVSFVLSDPNDDLERTRMQEVIQVLRGGTDILVG